MPLVVSSRDCLSTVTTLLRKTACLRAKEVPRSDLVSPKASPFSLEYSEQNQQRSLRPRVNIAHAFT